MHPKLLRAATLAGVVTAIAVGCSAGNPTGTVNSPYKSPLSNVMSPEDVAAAQSLEKTIALSFPIKVGIAYFDFTTGLKPEDEAKVIGDFKTALDSSGLADDTVLVPTTLLGGGSSQDAIRQLGAKFKTDLLVLVSGRTDQELGDDQPVSIFDSWGGRAYWEARTTLVAVTMDVRTGSYLSPFQAVGVKGPALLQFNSSGFYKLRQDAEFAAWGALRTQVVANLQKLKKNLASQPTPTPTPSIIAGSGGLVSPTPSASGSPAPSGSASPSPSASASGSPAASASPTASPAASGSPAASASPRASPSASATPGATPTPAS